MPYTVLPDAEIALRRERRTSFMGLLAIEANPLIGDEVAMFYMFDGKR